MLFVSLYPAFSRVEELAGSIESRTVDSVIAGEEQNERDHKMRGEKTDTREFNNLVTRFADTNGWFSWDLKVMTNATQELTVAFSGGDGRRGGTNIVQVFVDSTNIATEKFTDDGRGSAANLKVYPLAPGWLRGKTKITVKFEAAAGSRVPGVSSVRVMRPVPTIASMSKASSPRTTYTYIVNAINDQRDPTSSGITPNIKPHFDWWPSKNKTEWVQYDFAKPSRVSAVEVYWFDDTGRGECRPPKSWQALYRVNGEWKPVSNPSGYGCEDDKYNRTTFDAVETDGMRLEVQLPETFSSGLLQWKVE